MSSTSKKIGRYRQILTHIFLNKYHEGDTSVPFTRDDLGSAAVSLGIPMVKNSGDLIYTFRFRRKMPVAIHGTAKKDYVWIIRLGGVAKYRFEMLPAAVAFTEPRADKIAVKIPDSTPGLIARYALNDEQALLAVLRYNRLMDILLGITYYSLQNHLRTQIEDLGQTETDEIYVAVDRHGAHYVVPVQAKGGKDRLSIVQIEQDMAMCAIKFPQLKCVPVAAQFMGPRENRAVALFIFEKRGDVIGVLDERHYRMVPKEELSAEELAQYASDSRIG